MFDRFMPRLMRAAEDAEEAFAADSYGLCDVRLGQRILRSAVVVRASFPLLTAWAGAGDGYCGMLVWEIVPEIARRLGVRDFARGARPYQFRPPESPAPGDLLAFRNRTADAVFGSKGVFGPGYLADWDRLVKEPCDGNMVVMALDRVAPPTADTDDVLAERFRKDAAARGAATAVSWTPQYQGAGLRAF